METKTRMDMAMWCGAAVMASAAICAAAGVDPTITETRTIELTQTVTLHDVPAGAGHLRLWVPIPSDGKWQRVRDVAVVSAPGEWRMERQVDGRGNFLYVDVFNPAPGSHSVVVSATVERKGVYFAIDQAPASSVPLQSGLFREFLSQDAPLMEVDSRIREWADRVCGDERDPARQAVMLLQAVAAEVNHYSKDKSVPECGIGSAYNCMEQGGGCCTDLHALMVAMGRARGIPTRIQFGYRALDSRAGREFDPSYRCWVEFFLPGTGWVPTDLVASDGADSSNPYRWGSLSATRVWLWEGRSFELTPKAAAGAPDTMICGWAEIDGKTIDVLPDHDGKPSQLRRTIQFTVLNTDRTTTTAALPE